MKKHLVCIKIGGSIITDKSTALALAPEGISRFAESMSAAYHAYGDNVDFILGNGAGSFGHASAHEYGLREGAYNVEQFYGAALTHNNVRDLNLRLGTALNKHSVPATCLSPGDMLVSRQREIISGDIQSVEYALANKLVPVLHGDVVYDETNGVSIVSTERALLWFADALHELYEQITVIAITRTGGVLRSDGTVVPTLQRHDSVESLRQAGHDVTGSMDSKVQSLRGAAANGYTTYIIGNSEEELLAAIRHTPAGTRVL